MNRPATKSMKPILFAIVAIALHCGAIATCRAVIIVPFPGLEKAIQQSDAVAIIRIDRNLDAGIVGPYLMSKHDCYIYQSLKGNLKAREVVQMSLYDMESMASSFPRGSSHLVFLQYRSGVWMTCRFKRPTVRLAPLGNEKVPEGESIEAKIKVLLERSVKYWEEQWRNEREFMESLAK
jgi:hypothetical protein